MDISLTLDDRQLQAWISQLTTGAQLKRAASSAINKASQAARKEAFTTAAQDINVPIGIAKRNIRKPSRATEANLESRWMITKSRISILSTKGAKFVDPRGRGVTVKKGGRYYSKRSKRGSKSAGGLYAHTHAMTGGRSAQLHAVKAFMQVGGRGGMAAMVRVGKARKAIKPIYAELFRTGMSQSTGAPRKAWQTAALRAFVPAAEHDLQTVLSGGTVDPSAGVTFND